MWKLWNVIHAQLNKLANYFWTRDPIAQMQLEYDRSVEQLKEGRRGLEEYRGLVERVSRQVGLLVKKEQILTSKIKAYLKTEDRQTAGQLAAVLECTDTNFLPKAFQQEIINGKGREGLMTQFRLLKQSLRQV